MVPSLMVLEVYNNELHHDGGVKIVVSGRIKVVLEEDIVGSFG